MWKELRATREEAIARECSQSDLMVILDHSNTAGRLVACTGCLWEYSGGVWHKRRSMMKYGSIEKCTGESGGVWWRMGIYGRSSSTVEPGNAR